MVYGSETWALKKAHMEPLSVPLRRMERIMLAITLRDHIRFKDDRWTKRATEWTPPEWARRRGIPKTRWRDRLIRHLVPA